MARWAVVLVGVGPFLAPAALVRADDGEVEIVEQRAVKKTARFGFMDVSGSQLPRMSKHVGRDWSELIEAVELSDKQARAVRALQAKHCRSLARWLEAWRKSDEYAAWKNANRRIVELVRKREKDADALKAAQTEARRARKAVLAKREKLRGRIVIPREQTRKEVLAVLSPEQRVAWERHKLARRVNPLLKALELSDPQKQAVAKRFGRWAVRYPDLKPKEQRKVDDKLLDEIAGEVLLPKQREQLKAARERAPKQGRSVHLPPGLVILDDGVKSAVHVVLERKGAGAGGTATIGLKGTTPKTGGKAEKPETQPAE